MLYTVLGALGGYVAGALVTDPLFGNVLIAKPEVNARGVEGSGCGPSLFGEPERICKPGCHCSQRAGFLGGVCVKDGYETKVALLRASTTILGALVGSKFDKKGC